jgi:putative DNA primase/helicase
MTIKSSRHSAAYRHTRRIEFLGVGTDEHQARYLVLQIGKKIIVIRVGNLASNRNKELTRLERLGVPLVARGAQEEFISRAQEEAGKAATYRIVTTTGWDGLTFYFPDRVVPMRAAQVEFYLDEGLSDVHRRYQRAGTWAGTNELLSLCHNNSRLLLCVALSFVGPLLGPVAGETVGLQPCGPPGTGKTVTGIVSSSTWGWDPDPNHKLGFGTSWNTTLNALEPTLLGYNQTMAFLNETRTMADVGGGREAAILDAIMLAAEGKGKARYTEAGTRSFQAP